MRRPKKSLMPRRCTICGGTLQEAIRREFRPGISIRELAESVGVSRSALYRHLRAKHDEPLPLLPARPIVGEAGCAICKAGPEIRELVLLARRAEKSVRHMAVIVGVSRSAMRWHLRDCVPASLGLTRCDPSGPQTYTAKTVADVIARLDKRTK